MRRLLLTTAALAAFLCTISIPAKAVTLTAANVGNSGTTSLNGLVNGNVVPGLTGTLGLTFLSITNGGTSWNFSYTVDNRRRATIADLAGSRRSCRPLP
jgi:hypothetical protein